MDRQRIVCPDGITRVVTGVLRVPGEPDRYETNDGAWRVWECEEPPAPPVRRRAKDSEEHMEETDKATHLLGALSGGHTIVVAAGRFADWPVEYTPRSKGDERPWSSRQGWVTYRYTHAECRVRGES